MNMADVLSRESRQQMEQGMQFSDMTPGQLAVEKQQRDMARAILGFQMPGSPMEAFGKGALLAAPGSTIVGLGARGILGATEPDFQRAYQASQRITSEPLGPPGTQAPISLGPDNYAAQGGMAAGEQPANYGPRNAQTAGLTGADYVNAIADNPGAGSSRSDGTIICTELHRQGLMPDHIYRADRRFGVKMLRNSPLTMRGYHIWAGPVVKGMRRWNLVTRIMYAVATPWSHHMAHQMGVDIPDSRLGKAIQVVGGAISTAIGWVDAQSVAIGRGFRHTTDRTC